MKTLDLSYVILTYNFLLGLLLIVSGEKLGVMTGHLLGVRREKVARATHVACATLGSCLVAIATAVALISSFLR